MTVAEGSNVRFWLAYVMLEEEVGVAAGKVFDDFG